MKQKYLWVALICLLVLGILFALFRKSPSVSSASSGVADSSQSYHRIVSLAPSSTEILFALGLGDRVVGVTKFCNYPPEAKTRKQVGGYLDPNYEAIFLLKPDLVILLPEHEKSTSYFKELKLKTMTVEHNSINGILQAILDIGKTCGAQQKADSIVSDLKARMSRIEQKTQAVPKPRVLVCIGRNMGSGALKDVYIAGKDDFYDEMIRIASGANAYSNGSLKYPAVSAEGILQMNPQVVIDMVPDMAKNNWSEETVKKEWYNIGNIEAVKSNRVYIFGQDYVAVPGPRFILIVEHMAQVIHPEINGIEFFLTPLLRFLLPSPCGEGQGVRSISFMFPSPLVERVASRASRVRQTTL